MLAESVRVAAATRAVSGVVLLLAFVLPSAVLGVAGYNIESQLAILRRLDDIGTRTMTVVSSGGEPTIPASSVAAIARLEGVSWALGLGPVDDVHLGMPAGGPTPARTYLSVGAPVAFSGAPTPSGAFVSSRSARRVGLLGAYSVLEPGALRVVGWFRAEQPLSGLDAFVLVPMGETDTPLERVIVAVTDVGWIEPVAASLPSMIGARAAGSTSIERSEALVTARESIRDEISQRDRLLVVALMLVTVVIVTVVIFASTVASRRDFGRRRALGATRGQLTALVVLSTLWPTLIGVSIGTVAGVLYLNLQLGHAPDWTFPSAVAILAVYAHLVAAAIPAIVAATRDPLQVLRIP